MKKKTGKVTKNNKKVELRSYKDRCPHCNAANEAVQKARDERDRTGALIYQLGNDARLFRFQAEDLKRTNAALIIERDSFASTLGKIIEDEKKKKKKKKIKRKKRK